MKILMLVALCIMLVIRIFLSELEQNICATILFEQRLMRDTVMLSKATVKVASVHLGNMKPVALPKEVKAAFYNLK